MTKPDPYKDLDLPRSATPDQIKAAFRRKSKTEHPDAGGSEDAFHRINAAYRLLMSPERKARFDATGEIDDGPDNSASESLSIISDLMEQVMAEANDVVTTDLVGRMRETLDANIGEVERKIAQMKAQSKKLTRFATRFKRKKGQNLLRDMVMRKVGALQCSMTQGQAALRDLKAAQQILSDYSFTVDETPARRPGGFTISEAGLNSIFLRFGE